MKTLNKIFLFIAILLIGISGVFAQTPIVKNCCEKTTYGAWCQNAPADQCDTSNGLKNAPTSCEATSFCKPGCCYDSSEGVCMENTPQQVCQNSKGTWNADKNCEIGQCNLGCCVLGKQAAFVTLTRCKKMSAIYGLTTDFRKQIGNELDCISLASIGDEGACVYELDYIKTCKFTTRQECNSIKSGKVDSNGTVTGNITFYKDYLCSAEELGTNCGVTKDTMCIEGKDEVYFKDTCGNPANIYDAAKVNDKAYWRKKVSKEESCNPASPNKNSKTCGNCNYFSGSICKNYKKLAQKPVYGDNICVNLDCPTTSAGKPYKHGESWCSTDKNVDSVGSRYIRHICMNAEEIIEPCADYRQETCIQDFIDSKGIKFSQAGCRVNRWQDCLTQVEKRDCENTDKRDCIWTAVESEVKNGTRVCFPKNPPGLKFWEEGESQGICSAANIQCVVEYEKTGFFTGGGPECVKNCECLSETWLNKQLKRCESIGDCGAKINFVGAAGYKEGYKTTITKVKNKK